MTALAEVSAIKKASYSRKNSFVLAILGGAYIALGGIFATVAAVGAADFMSFGLTKMLMGVAFSLGLILVVVGGAELFTGSTLVSVAWLNREIKITDLIKNWTLVYLGNFLGAIIIAALLFLAREYLVANGAFGQTIFAIANSKMHHTFFEAVALGILCNVLVCLAIWLSFSGKNTVDKIVAIVFPVTAFIAMGFEHSIANMYLITEALLIKTFDPAFVVYNNINTFGLSWTNFFLHNLLPVTIGNIIGGVLIWLAYWYIYSNGREKV